MWKSVLPAKRASWRSSSTLRVLQANRAGPGTFPDIELRELRLAAEKTLLQLEQAEQNLAIERLKHKEQLEILKTYRLVAPHGGIVRTVHKRSGEVVAEGEPILEIVHTRTVRVEGHLSIADAARVTPAMRVEVRLLLDRAGDQVDGRVFSWNGDLC